MREKGHMGREGGNKEKEGERERVGGREKEREKTSPWFLKVFLCFYSGVLKTIVPRLLHNFSFQFGLSSFMCIQR